MDAASAIRRPLGLALLIGGVVVWMLMRGERDLTVRAELSVDATLGGADTVGFERALEPRTFVFPADHGPHPGFRNEWWYLTGNLESVDGRRFGYQLTWFRGALSSSMQPRDSEWASRQAWMAHFALTDASGGQFHAFERFARGALGLAGATAAPFRVWLENWSIETSLSVPGVSPSASNARTATSGTANSASIFPLRVRATEGDIAIDFLLDSDKPMVLNGESGLSRKGADPGNASFYYAFTRVATAGTVRVGDDTFTVSGNTWLDRELSTSALADGVAGWDWFAIQLSDSTELMVYRLRREDGSIDPFSAGTFVMRDGSTTALGARDVSIESTGSWRSPVDGTSYPARWTVAVPSLDFTLDIQPVFASQELNLSFRYWEGAVTASGSRAGDRVRGRGYVELTGYSGSRTRSPMLHKE